MVKKIIYIPFVTLIVGFCSFLMQSCNYLDIDQYINDMQSLDTLFQKKGQTEQFLYNVYSYLPSPGSSLDPQNGKSVPWIGCTDEAFDVEKNSTNDFCNNIFTADIDAFSRWKSYYIGIRNASIFLQRVYECKELTSIELRQYIGEAQFLKAYFYFELMKQYGPVCIVPESGFTLEQPIDEILISRNTWDECVTYVDNLLKQAATNLPVRRPTSEFGKPTSGAANAVRSRLLLYAASPLFNGNTSYSDFVDKKTGIPYINQKEDNSKWAAAAVAAKIVIEGQYELHTVPENDKTMPLPTNVESDIDYYENYPKGAKGIDAYLSYANMFNGSTSGSLNKEIIFAMPAMSLDKDFAPLKLYGISRYNMPQKLVDAYYMCNGKTIEEGASDPNYRYDITPSESSKNFSGYILPSEVYGWYLNREMRFYASVGFNNSYYFGSSSTKPAYRNFGAEYFEGGNCSLDIAGGFIGYEPYYCMTGYLCRKFQNPEDCYAGSYGTVKKKVWIDYRLAEIYMNYIEALNELEDTYVVDNYTVSREPAEIMKYFNFIRHRAGLPGITMLEAKDQKVMEQLIQRERQIEFAWEGLRYFDLRRWKTAVIEENGPITGMAVYKPKSDYYRLVQIHEVNFAYKAFTMRKNFWPIPQKEVTKNSNLVQNPGWE